MKYIIYSELARGYVRSFTFDASGVEIVYTKRITEAAHSFDRDRMEGLAQIVPKGRLDTIKGVPALGSVPSSSTMRGFEE